MSKYAKLIGITLFTIISFCIYGIAKTSAETTTNLKIETTEGDDTYADSFNLSGYIYGESNTLLPTFHYTDGAFELKDESSFFEILDASIYLTADQLMEEHKSFMRGKSPYAQFKVEDEKVVYAASDTDQYWQETSTNQLNVSLLDKANDEISDYTFSLPEDSSGTSLESVRNFYVQYPMVYFTLLTAESNNSSLYKIYSADLSKETPELQLVREIDSKLSTLDSLYSSLSESANNHYLGLAEINYNEYEMSVDSFTIYDYETDTLLETQSLEGIEQPNLLSDGENLYITSPSENGLTVYQVDTSAEPAALSPIFELPASENGPILPAFISNNLLYSYEEHYDSVALNYSIQINDLNTGDLLYKGEILGEDSEPVDMSLIDIQKAAE